MLSKLGGIFLLYIYVVTDLFRPVSYPICCTMWRETGPQTIAEASTETVERQFVNPSGARSGRLLLLCYNGTWISLRSIRHFHT